jgi:nitrogen regulatory protein PII
MNTTVTIYTIFLPCYSPRRDELLEKLQSRLDDVELIGLDELSGIMSTEGRDEAYRSIREMKDELDGILVFGGYLDHELTSLGLPVVMVRSLFGVGDWEKGILSFYRGEKVVTACLSDFDISSRASTSRFDDLLDKIKLISALKKVRDSRLLVVQEPEILGSYDILGMDFHSPLPEDYSEVYSENLKEMGPEVTHASLIELNEEIGKTDEKEAGPIADMWMKEAEEVRETNREEVLKAAKLYLGMERLMKRYGATGIAIRSLVPWVTGVLNVTPCLANTELNKQLRVGVCEGLVNSAITEMFGFYVTGNPSFVGDVVGIDRVNDTITFAHCQCPINPHGTDRVPYIIRSHALQKGNKMLPDDYPEAGPTLSAAVQVELPMDEIVTATKFSIYDRKIAVSTGVSVSGDEFYKGFESILCRTKLVMKTNSAAFERNYDTVTFGVHRNTIYGDHRAGIKDLATLIGFDVVEEDRL